MQNARGQGEGISIKSDGIKNGYFGILVVRHVTSQSPLSDHNLPKLITPVLEYHDEM